LISIKNHSMKYADFSYSKTVKSMEFVSYATSQIIALNEGELWQCVDFENMSKLVECIEKNVKSGVYSLRHIDKKSWQFGTKYFPNLEKTRFSLINGIAPDSLTELAEKEKEKLLEQFPELWDLQKFAFKKRRRRTFAEEGGELNIDRFMSGEPEMWQKTKTKIDKKTIRVAFNGAMLMDATEDNFVKNMITVAAMIDVFTGFGLSVEFIYTALSRGVTTKTHGVATSAIVKGADEPLDLSRLLSCCSPGLFRYFIFAARENIAEGQRTPSGGKSTYETPDFYREYKNIDVAVSAKSTQSEIVVCDLSEDRAFLQICLLQASGIDTRAKPGYIDQ